MREILFRGKRIDNGEWIEGSLVVAGDYCCILPADETSVHPTDYPYLDSETGTIDGHLIPVDPSTVGQCVSGLTDKNGKKIFEGDIIGTRIWSEFDDTTVWREGVVVFKNGGYFISLNGSGLDVFIFEERYEEPYFEILGNIHDDPLDNPELLEDKP